MNKMKKFEVYTLDMFPDGDGGWVENERQKIGTIEIQSSEQAFPEAILNALRNLICSDIAGREHHVLNTTDSRSQAMAILQAWDRGIGDVDDVIDAYEAAQAY